MQLMQCAEGINYKNDLFYERTLRIASAHTFKWLFHIWAYSCL